MMINRTQNSMMVYYMFQDGTELFFFVKLCCLYLFVSFINGFFLLTGIYHQNVLLLVKILQKSHRK